MLDCFTALNCFTMLGCLMSLGCLVTLDCRNIDGCTGLAAMLSTMPGANVARLLSLPLLTVLCISDGSCSKVDGEALSCPSRRVTLGKRTSSLVLLGLNTRIGSAELDMAMNKQLWASLAATRCVRAVD